MAKVNFYLKEKKSSTETLIFLSFLYHGQRFRYSTSLKIHPQNWNFNQWRAKVTASHKKGVEINKYLNKLEAHTIEAYEEKISSGVIPTTDELKNYIDSKIDRKIDEKNEIKAIVSFFEYYQNYIDLRKPILAKSTIKSYQNSLNQLKKYCQKALKKNRLEWINIDTTFAIEYQGFLYEKGHAYNYVAKQFNVLRGVLKDADENNELIKVNPAYKNKRFRLTYQEVHNVALDFDKLKKMYYANLSGLTPLHSEIRDRFVVACLTALRFGDSNRVNSKHISEIDDENGGKYKVFKILTGKTGAYVMIPLHDFVLEIIQKYGGNLPDGSVGQVANRYLKEIAKVAELTEDVVSYKSIGGKKVECIVPFNEMITNHTARRTFASIAFYEWGISAADIMPITGHKTESEFFKYVKASSQRSALNMLKGMRGSGSGSK